MSEQFKVGDICIGQNHVHDVEYNGMECEIVAGWGLHPWYLKSTGEVGEDFAYLVVWATGEKCVCFPQNIRKKQPPRSAKAIMRATILKAKQPQMVPA